MRQNPNYRNNHLHGLPAHYPVIGVGLDYIMPKVFDTHESHGTLVHGGFGPEPQVNSHTRQRNETPIVPVHRARKLNRRLYAKVHGEPFGVGQDYNPWEQGQAAARHGKGLKSCHYAEGSPERAEWLDGFNTE